MSCVSHSRDRSRRLSACSAPSGHIDAFSGLGSAGSASLRAVAPAIFFRSLADHRAGLFVAIPAVSSTISFAEYPHSCAAPGYFLAGSRRAKLKSIQLIGCGPQRTAAEQKLMRKFQTLTQSFAVRDQHGPVSRHRLVLLIIFMITAPILHRHRTRVPKLRPSGSKRTKSRRQYRQKKQLIYLGNEAVNVHDLGPKAQSPVEEANDSTFLRSMRPFLWHIAFGRRHSSPSHITNSQHRHLSRSTDRAWHLAERNDHAVANPTIFRPSKIFCLFSRPPRAAGRCYRGIHHFSPHRSGMGRRRQRW